MFHLYILQAVKNTSSDRVIMYAEKGEMKWHNGHNDKGLPCKIREDSDGVWMIPKNEPLVNNYASIHECKQRIFIDADATDEEVQRILRPYFRNINRKFIESLENDTVNMLRLVDQYNHTISNLNRLTTDINKGGLVQVVERHKK